MSCLCIGLACPTYACHTNRKCPALLASADSDDSNRLLSRTSVHSNLQLLVLLVLLVLQVLLVLLVLLVLWLTFARPENQPAR